VITTVDNSWVVLSAGANGEDVAAGTNTTAASAGGNPMTGYYGPKTPAGSIGLTVTSTGSLLHYNVASAIEPAGGGGSPSFVPAIINNPIRGGGRVR
jgi:hypothetical protein